MRRTTATVVLALVVGACGVPAGDDTFEDIADPDVPFNLAAPSTTTTTTTTTTLPPLPETTTTLPPEGPEVDLEPVSLYFITGEELRPIEREIESGFAPLELIALLAAGPDPETSPGLESVVEPDLVRSIEVRDGTATVDVDDNIYNRVSRDDQLGLFAQIVLTLTQSAPRIGLVTFTFDGAADNVPIPNNFFRRTVSFDQYATLIANAIVNPAPTTAPPSDDEDAPTTTVPDTTAPPDDAEAEAEAEAEAAESAATTTTTTATTATTATTTTIVGE